jgi:response regulator RpfG family c-di-GMP phosphodiesterase
MEDSDESKAGSVEEPDIAEPEIPESGGKRMENEQIPRDTGDLAERKQEPSTHEHNILVVDDEEDVLDALERTLRDEYHVFSAANGEDALSIVEKHDIALVIADHRMPGMTGIELLRTVMEKSPNTIRVILSGYIDQKMLMDAISTVHIHDIISKPYGIEEVRFTVRRWVEQYKRIKGFEDKAKQSEDLERQLAESNKALVEAEQSHSAEVERLTRQLEESKRLLEHYQVPWWRRWFRK